MKLEYKKYKHYYVIKKSCNHPISTLSIVSGEILECRIVYFVIYTEKMSFVEEFSMYVFKILII